MDLSTYQRLATRTAIYPDKGSNLAYPSLGLAGEAGEVCNKVKKYYRDGELDSATLGAELGDVLWYLAAVAEELGLDLSTIADANIEKLASRAARGTLGGSGDNR